MYELYSSIHHDSGLKALKNILNKIKNQNISTAELIKMAEFVLRNNYFEFNGKVEQQISGTAIGTKCRPTYACIYMDEFENDFLSLRSDKPLSLPQIYISSLHIDTNIYTLRYPTQIISSASFYKVKHLE